MTVLHLSLTMHTIFANCLLGSRFTPAWSSSCRKSRHHCSVRYLCWCWKLAGDVSLLNEAIEISIEDGDAIISRYEIPHNLL